jgi:hypothetical protein
VQRVRLFLRRLSPQAVRTTSLFVGGALVAFVVLIAVSLALGWDLWVWVDRASWVIALVLFPAAIYQLIVLQRDQRRIADELTKQPDVRVGLRTQEPAELPAIEPDFKIAAIWQAGSPLSDVVTIPLSAVNVGSATAYDVLINVLFPTSVQLVQGPPGSSVRNQPEIERWQLMFQDKGTLNIGVTMDIGVSVRLGGELDRHHGVALLAHVSTKDRPYVTSELIVRYEPRSAAPPSPQATPEPAPQAQPDH